MLRKVLRPSCLQEQGRSQDVIVEGLKKIIVVGSVLRSFPVKYRRFVI